MSLIKKLLIPLVSSFLISTSISAFEVGDKFPKIPSQYILNSSQWYNEDKSKKGETIYYDLNQDGQIDITIVSRDCSGKKLEFGLFDVGELKLYLDNKPHDGIIDEIIEIDEDRFIHDDAPDCPYDV